MKYSTVSALCEGVAGAIREKEGSTALINPQDFPDRIKGLEVGGGGIPDVPTLECWKIDASSLSDDDKQNCRNAISDFAYGNSEGSYGKCIVLSEIDGNIYGGMGPLYIIGSGRADLTASIFYIAFTNVGDINSFISSDLQWFKEVLDYCVELNCGEQISLSNFLSLAAQAQNYEDQYGWD